MDNTAIRYYAPKTVANTSLNGGRMSANRIITGVGVNVWPEVFEDDRVNETTLFRKIFGKAHDDDDGSLVGAKFFLDYDAKSGDDYGIFWAGTHIDTQGDITGSERFYAAGTLNSDVSAGGGTIIVTFKNSSQVAGIQAGDKVRISNKSTPTATSGTEETLTVNEIVSTTGPSVTFTTTTTLANSYVAGAKVSTVYEAGTIATSITGTGYTGGANIDFDAIVLDNIGTVYEQLTGLFTDSSTFTMTGDTLGSLISGTVSADYAPQNSDWSKPLFTIPASVWSGLTISAGDGFSFTTVPAAAAMWMKKVNPADAATVVSNSMLLHLRGQSS